MRGRQIIIETAEKHGLSEIELRLPCSTTAVSDRPRRAARYEAMWRIHNETSLSLKVIARLFRLGCHTSIINGIRKHEERMSEAAE